MKITFFLTGFGKSGGPLIHYSFMNGLLKKGHKVYVVTRNESFEWYTDAYKNFIDKPQTQNKKVNLRRIINFIIRKISDKRNSTFPTRDTIANISNFLIQNYQKLQIDSDILIASHTYTADAVHKLGMNKKIVMYNMHFEELMFENEYDRAEIRMLNYLPFNHISLSTWLQKMFEYNYGIKSKLITPGIDTNIFNGNLNKNKYIGVKTIKLITYCDPYRKFKAINQQIDILNKLYAKNKKIEILIYGHDPKTNLFPYKFLGWIPQSQLAKFYAESHVLLSFSWYESFPLPPIEAMACGCAVVAGKYGTEDYLIDNHSGIIINPLNIEESVNKINNLINQPKLMFTLASNGQKIASKFTWEKQIEKLNDFLLNLPSPKSIDITKIQGGILQEFDKIYD